MPRKQRFKPSRKPKPMNEEVGKPSVEQQTQGNSGERLPEREEREIHPDDSESEGLDRVNGMEGDRSR